MSFASKREVLLSSLVSTASRFFSFRHFSSDSRRSTKLPGTRPGGESWPLTPVTLTQRGGALWWDHVDWWEEWVYIWDRSRLVFVYGQCVQGKRGGGKTNKGETGGLCSVGFFKVEVESCRLLTSIFKTWILVSWHHSAAALLRGSWMLLREGIAADLFMSWVQCVCWRRCRFGFPSR